MDPEVYMSIKRHGTHRQAERLKASGANRDLLPLFDHMARTAFQDEELFVFLDDDALAEDLGLSAEQLGEQLDRLENLALIKRLEVETSGYHGWDVGPLAFHPDDFGDDDDSVEGESAPDVPATSTMPKSALATIDRASRS